MNSGCSLSSALGVEACRLGGQEIVPADVALVVPGRVVEQSSLFQTSTSTNAARFVHGAIGDRLHRHRSAPPQRSVRGDQHRHLRIRQACGDGLRTEPAEDRHPDRAELGARQERSHGLDRHGHEDADGVALPHAERAQTMRQPVGQLPQLPVRDPADVAVLGLPDHRDGLRGPVRPDVDALVREVGRPAGEPRGPFHPARRVQDLLVRRQERDARGPATTASQNHSMSPTDRATSSSYVAIPWARMNRVTFARSTYSGDGDHTTSCTPTRYNRVDGAASRGGRDRLVRLLPHHPGRLVQGASSGRRVRRSPQTTTMCS